MTGGHSTQDLHFTGFWIIKEIVEWQLGTKHIWGSIGKKIAGKREGDIFDEVKLKKGLWGAELEKRMKRDFWS